MNKIKRRTKRKWKKRSWNLVIIKNNKKISEKKYREENGSVEECLKKVENLKNLKEVVEFRLLLKKLKKNFAISNEGWKKIFHQIGKMENLQSLEINIEREKYLKKLIRRNNMYIYQRENRREMNEDEIGALKEGISKVKGIKKCSLNLK